MSNEDLRKLLGGYATNTLSQDEQKALFAAAMEDQQLFDALADEESLRELLADPASRREVLASLEPEQSVWARTIAWFRKPTHLVLAGGLATALVVTVAVRNITKTPEYQTVATRTTPAAEAPEADARPPAAPSYSVAEKEPEPQRRAEPAKAKAREERAQNAAAGSVAGVRSDKAAVPPPAVMRDESTRAAAPQPAYTPPPPPPQQELAAAAPKPTAVKESVAVSQDAQAPARLRVAVLNVNSTQGAKQQPDQQLTKDLADRLNQATTQYSLVDQREVDRVLEEKKLTGTPLDSATAASVGRSLGADAVIVGNAAQPAAIRPMLPGAGLRRQQPREKAEAKSEPPPTAITAQMIDTKKATSQFVATANSIDRVASQLAQFKVEGAITDVNGTVLTINIGTPAGVKTGDRFQVLRQEQIVGELRITTPSAAYAVGVFTGSGKPQSGDVVRRILD